MVGNRHCCYCPVVKFAMFGLYIEDRISHSLKVREPSVERFERRFWERRGGMESPKNRRRWSDGPVRVVKESCH